MRINCFACGSHRLRVDATDSSVEPDDHLLVCGDCGVKQTEEYDDPGDARESSI